MIKSTWKAILLILVMLAAVIGVQAQEATEEAEMQSTILELAQNTEDLSTLVAAVQAADPAIADALGADGEYTVFAPSNQAFENLAITLGVDAETLLADENLTSILQYHVALGEILAEDLAEQDGGFVETILPDNFIGVTIAEDGTVVLNDVVTVTAADIDASNGVVHVVDDVLLPQSALEAFGLVEADNTNVQVLHFSPDAPNVDVYVDGTVAIQDLTYGAASGYVTLRAGDYEVAVAPTGTSIENAVIGPVTLTLNAGDFLNVAAIGSVEAGTLNVTAFTQAVPILEENEFGLTVVHAVENAPNVDLVLNDTTVIEALAYPFTEGTNDGAFNLIALTPVESLTVNVSEDGSTLLDLSDTMLVTGNYYLVVVGGTADAPMPYVYPLQASRAEELTDALYDSNEEPEAEMTPEAEEDSMDTGNTIADIVVDSTTAETSQFTILLEAVQNADASVLEILQGSAPVTVFAPTDEAFTNLLSATGLTAEELLESELLTDILAYHVVAGELDSEAVASDSDNLIPTLLPDTYIGVSTNDAGALVLNEVVGFVETDIEASNGIIHVIDEVLLPQSAVEALGL